jgi:stage IV sporulation protein FB
MFGSPMLVFIALFVWIGAAEEAALVHRSAALDHVRVGDAMVTVFQTLPAASAVGDGAQVALHSTQPAFPVVDHDRLVGLVGTETLLERAASGAGAAPVAAVSRAIAEVAGPGEPIEAALERLQQADQSVLPVIEAGRLVGLLFPQNVLQLAEMRDRKPVTVE